MRWLWIDRFVEFVRGERAVAIKNISMVEEQIDGYLPGYPVMPASLIVEGMAQTGGLLVCDYNNFQERVVLAKVSKATFHSVARPGDTLIYSATLRDINDAGAYVEGVSRIGDEVHAEIDLFFAHLDKRVSGEQLFHPADFLAMLRLFGLYDVAVDKEGNRLDPPPHLLEAEKNGHESNGSHAPNWAATS